MRNPITFVVLVAALAVLLFVSTKPNTVSAQATRATDSITVDVTDHSVAGHVEKMTEPSRAIPNTSQLLTETCCQRACAGLEGAEFNSCVRACEKERTGGGPCRSSARK